MELKLTNKIALVSGSTAGIGLAIAPALAQEGALVIVNGRSQQRVSAAIEQIKKTAPDANLQGVVADLSTSDRAEALFGAVPEIDILVNNLGIYEAKAFGEISDIDAGQGEAHRRCVETHQNIREPLLTTWCCFADASLVAAAEALGMRRIFTLDSNFYVYRLHGTEAFEVIP